MFNFELTSINSKQNLQSLNKEPTDYFTFPKPLPPKLRKNSSLKVFLNFCMIHHPLERKKHKRAAVNDKETEREME